MKRYIPLLLIIGSSFMAWYMGIYRYLTFETLQTHYEMLQIYIHLYPIRSIGCFMALYITIVGLSIPGATFMTLVGGLLFGLVPGTLSVILSATIGATILFMGAKLASQDLVRQRASQWIERMKEGFQKNAFSYLLFLRLIPIFPFMAVNLVAAVFQIPLRTFIIATFFGIIPGSLIYVSIGNALKSVILSQGITPKVILEPKLILALVGLGILSLLPILYKRIFGR